MNNRSAARELIILALPQLPKEETKLESIDLEKLFLALSRSLSDYAKLNITSVASDLQKIEKYFLNAEIDHPDNEERTSQIKPVLIPDTKVLREKISEIQNAATQLYSILELPELITHTKQDPSVLYAQELLKHYIQNKEKVNEVIE